MVANFSVPYLRCRVARLDFLPRRIVVLGHPICVSALELEQRRNPPRFTLYSPGDSWCRGSASAGEQRQTVGSRDSSSADLAPDCGLLRSGAASYVPFCDGLSSVHLFPILSGNTAANHSDEQNQDTGATGAGVG